MFGFETRSHELGQSSFVMRSNVCMFMLTDISRAVELLDKLQRTGEVPPQKLQALQRVLQSEFCNAVREVTCSLLCQVLLCFWRHDVCLMQSCASSGV